MTRLGLVSSDSIDSAWPSTGVTRLLEEYLGTKSVQRTIDHHPDAGYRLYASGFGLAQIAPDGRYVRCANSGIATWRWQRFLVGRVLPWAAVLRGLEVFHASAVTIEGQAVALVGPTGAGKTSLAVRLVLDGAVFLTDDVLALDRDRAGEPRAHPGASIVALRAAEWAALGPGQRRRLGSLLGRDDKTYVAVAGAPAAASLGAVYFLTSGGAAASGIEPLTPPDPSVLLASTFVMSLSAPDRLHNLLDVCAAVSRSVPSFRVSVQSSGGAKDLARRLRTHAREVLGAQ